MARYGWRLTAGRGTLEARFNDTLYLAMNATGVGLYGVAPVARPSAYTQTYATADKTHANLTATSIAATVPAAVATTGVTQTSPFGYVGAAQGDAVATTINSIITHITELDLDYEALLVDVTDLKQLANSVIDDLQALGLLQ